MAARLEPASALAMNGNAEVEPEHGAIDLRKRDAETSADGLLGIEVGPAIEGIAGVEERDRTEGSSVTPRRVSAS
jgi:hypothetical protein